MFQKWSMRQKALIAAFFGLVLVSGVTLAFLGGKLKFQASQVLEPYTNQAQLSYTDSQGQSRTVESNIVKLQFSPPGTPSFLNGTVTSVGGQPVAGATVLAYKFTRNDFRGSFIQVAETTTDGSGIYNFQEPLPTGAYMIIAAPAGAEMKLIWGNPEDGTYVPSSTGSYARKPLKITEGQKSTLNLVVRPTERYTNRVFIYHFPTNEVLPNARVLLRDISTGKLQDFSTGRIVYDKTTDENGEFSVYPEDNVTDGDYYLLIAKKGYTYTLSGSQIKIPTYLDHMNPRQIGSVAVFANEPENDAINKNELKGIIKNEAGNPVGNVVLILKRKVQPAYHATLITGSDSSTGTFNFVTLCKDTTKLPCVALSDTSNYSLEVIPGPGYNSITIDPVHLIKDQPTELPPIILTSSAQGASESLPQAPSGTALSDEEITSTEDQLTQTPTLSVISGTLTDEKTKQPIASATVSLIDKKNKVISKAVTSKEGKYELYFEPKEGKATFKATKDNYRYTKKNIDLSQNKDQTISPEIKKSNWFVSWMRKAASSISGFFKKIF